MHEFWHAYVKPKYGEKAKLCYIDRDNFIVHVKTDDIYKDTAEYDETRFGTSNFEIDRPLLKGKCKKVIGLIKDYLGGKKMIKFVGLKAKTSSYFIDDVSVDRKTKDTKKCAIKIKLKFEIHENCLEATQLEN